MSTPTPDFATLPSTALIGLGAMGATLARLTLRAGADTIVWNRTRAKSEALVAEGARAAPDVAAALATAEVVIVCVQDIAVGQSLLESAASSAATLQGRVFVHLSTGDAADARAAQAWAQRHGALLLAGAIQAAPAQMGRADTALLVSGDEQAWRIAAPALRLYGGNLVYLGADAGAAPTMDLATLSYVYGASIGLIHGAHIAEAAGIDLRTFGRIVAEIAPSFGEFLRHEANVIHSGDFTITESPLSISIEATDRLQRTARASGLNDEFPALAASLFRRAGEAGLAREEAAALIKILRRDTASAHPVPPPAEDRPNTKSNRVTWFSLPSDDLSRATRFYAEAFGWQIEPLTVEADPDFSFHVALNHPSDHQYVQLARGGLNGCLVKRSIGLPTPAVLIEVDDLAAAIARAERAGGRVVSRIISMPALQGRFVLVQDPDGNHLELFQSTG